MRRTDQRRAAVVALYQRDVTGRPLEELIDPHATPFTRELVEGVDADIEQLDALIERFAEGWEWRKPLTRPELFGGFEHPRGAPAQSHLPVPPPLHVGGVVSADLDHRLDRVCGAQRAGQGGGTPKRVTVSVSESPSRRLPAAPGWLVASWRARSSSVASAASASGLW